MDIGKIIVTGIYMVGLITLGVGFLVGSFVILSKIVEKFGRKKG